jgi:hypothetical protein
LRKNRTQLLTRLMSQVTEIVALVFDFDDTLVPDSTTKLLQAHGIDSDTFFGVHAKNLIDEGYDPPLAYLNLILQNIGSGKPFGQLTNKSLIEFGATLDACFHEGLPEFFDDVRDQTKTQFKNIDVEFYIISGGLQPILEGSAIVRKYFKAVYGCQLDGDTEDGPLKYIKRCITFTEKTRYLFEINKGIDSSQSKTNPYLVNEAKKPEDRRIPFENMIYVGDGQTDIPCFSMLKQLGGAPFGVFDPKNKAKAKASLEKLLQPDRVIGMHAPKYSQNEDLGSLLRLVVAQRCLSISVKTKLAL